MKNSVFKVGAFLFLMLVPAIAVPVADTFSDPAMETRARALQRQLRCLVCQLSLIHI